MSDFAQSVLIDGLLNNRIDRQSLTNVVRSGASDFGQFTELTRCGKKKDQTTVMLCQPVTTGSSSSSSSSNTAASSTKKINKKCVVCHHDHETANDLMKKKLEMLCLEVKNSEHPTHYMRDPMLVTTDLEQILTNKTTLVWSPHTIPGCPPLSTLTCWNDKCLCRGKIKVIRCLHKTFEGFDEKGNVIYAEYRCTQCNKDKSSLEAAELEKMGIPLNIIKKMPVINLSCSTWSLDYYNLCCLATTTEMGMSSFASLTAKARSARWASDACTYLQV
jgi:hypothetical protein